MDEALVQLIKLKETALLDITANANNEHSLSQVKAKYLGKAGVLTSMMKNIASLSIEEKRAYGQTLNSVKTEIEEMVKNQLLLIREKSMLALKKLSPDVTLPGRATYLGKKHPLVQVWEEIEDIFISLGFGIAEGPDIETEFFNFEALNMPEGHPARDMQDTFYVDDGLLLRTQTSAVQARFMIENEPPVRVIVPGTVYRSDMDMSHSPMFHQVEGLMVDTNISFSDLKGVLLEFVKRLFDPKVEIKFRASFFPFTEPSAEVDLLCFLCYGKGCRTCKNSGWIEIGGCGMVNPAVFSKIGKSSYDPDKVRGFAFGMGIDRITMLKLGIADLRLLFENDIRLLSQF